MMVGEKLEIRLLVRMKFGVMGALEGVSTIWNCHSTMGNDSTCFCFDSLIRVLGAKFRGYSRLGQQR